MAMRNAVLRASTTSIMVTADEPRSTERVSSPNLPDIWDTQALTFMPVGEKKKRQLEVEILKGSERLDVSNFHQKKRKTLVPKEWYPSHCFYTLNLSCLQYKSLSDACDNSFTQVN